MNNLIVKRKGVQMNRHCRHSPKAAKDCPYCNFCKHGCTEHMICDECSKHRAFMKKPITRREIEQCLREFASIDPGYLRRRHPSNPRNGNELALIPLAVKKFRELLAAESASSRKSRRRSSGRT